MKRGDVYLADLDPVKGTEQAGRRPVLIFEDDRLIPVTLPVVVIPFTKNVRMQKLPRYICAQGGGWFERGLGCDLSPDTRPR
jgi:mRNA interferase MazF